MSYWGGNIVRKYKDSWIADYYYEVERVTRDGIVSSVMGADRKTLREGKQG